MLILHFILFNNYLLFFFHNKLSPHSADVRVDIRKRFRDNSEIVLRNRQVPRPDAQGEGVHQVPPDPQPPEAEVGGILPARLVVHKRNRYEHGEFLFVCN